jgi:hypothetical protein
MGYFDHFLRDVRQILFRGAEQNAIPSMDGALSPNEALDRCTPIGDALAGLDDVVAAPDGTLLVSAGCAVLQLSGSGFARRTQIMEFDGPAGALAFHPDGELLVCVAGRGLAKFAIGKAPRWLETASGASLTGLTDVAAAPEGSIYLAEGSIGRRPSEWTRDLMEKRRHGRLLRTGAGLEQATVLREDLAFPSGLLVEPDGQSLLWCEAWTHAVKRAALAGEGLGETQIVARNLVGYPARPSCAAEGSYWVPFFGVRTHLTEFILREDEFRDEMLRSVPERYWLGPALSSGHDCLEPMQIGSLKALGIQKPWAPPRSYGLLTRMDASGDFVESLHSRADGKSHGIVAAVETPQGLVIVSKGAQRLLLRGGGQA